jgi:uncharacterized protein
MPADGTFAYFDTSVLVKSYVAEPGTPAALRLLGRYAILSSAIATVELASAIRYHRAQRKLTARELSRIEARIADERPLWNLLAVDGSVLERAEALTRVMAVKTLDAVHVASALVFEHETGLRVPFVTGDDQQRRAATALGLAVVFVG